jgi:hypothetical protein
MRDCAGRARKLDLVESMVNRKILVFPGNQDGIEDNIKARIEYGKASPEARKSAVWTGAIPRSERVRAVTTESD